MGNIYLFVNQHVKYRFFEEQAHCWKE